MEESKTAAISIDFGTDSKITTNINNNRIIDKSNEIQVGDSKSNSAAVHCVKASLPSLILVSCVMISVVIGRHYIVDMLFYIDTLDLWQSALIFQILFISVSFPIMWGYVLLNIACGYSYGFILGTVVTCICAAVGMISSHFIIRKFFKVSFFMLIRFCFV